MQQDRSAQSYWWPVVVRTIVYSAVVQACAPLFPWKVPFLPFFQPPTQKKEEREKLLPWDSKSKALALFSLSAHPFAPARRKTVRDTETDPRTIPKSRPRYLSPRDPKTGGEGWKTAERWPNLDKITPGV